MRVHHRKHAYINNEACVYKPVHINVRKCIYLYIKLTYVKREIRVPPSRDLFWRKPVLWPISLQTNKSKTEIIANVQVISLRELKINKNLQSEPAVIFKLAKLPDVVESVDDRELNEKFFADPDSDLNWSKVFMLGNPNFCISKSITDCMYG